jgi:hypothetical protein
MVSASQTPETIPGATQLFKPAGAGIPRDGYREVQRRITGTRPSVFAAAFPDPPMKVRFILPVTFPTAVLREKSALLAGTL